MKIQRTILLALCFFAGLLGAAEIAAPSGLSVRLRESELARRAAEQRCIELKAALADAERRTARLRQQNAALQVELSRSRKALTTLRLQAGQLLLDQVPSEKDRLLKEAVESLEQMRVAQADLCRRVEAFQKYLDAVLEVLQPSRALRRQIANRYGLVIQAAKRLENWPSQVAGRGGRSGVLLESRVVAVNDALNLVVLDSGSDAGVRTGATARVLSKSGRVTAELRVVEVRKRLSAAVPVNGKLRDIAPGAAVRFGVQHAR